ncbi:unnamed protein product, partial [Polarella glacialis]
ANPNLLDEHGNLIKGLNPDHMACGESIVEILGANERLLAASRAGLWDQLDRELRLGAWVNVRDETRRIALMWAGRQGASAAVTSLVGKNGDLEARDAVGWYTIHF